MTCQLVVPFDPSLRRDWVQGLDKYGAERILHHSDFMQEKHFRLGDLRETYQSISEALDWVTSLT
jgi:hypothetical protein